MRYRHVNIDSFAYESPPEVVSSSEIEERLSPAYERLALPKGRLEFMTGVRERRLWPTGSPPSHGAILAGGKALDASNVPREKIGCLMMCSVCRDFLEPATATIVHERLNLPNNAYVFDVSNACLGVLTGMVVLASMIELGQVEAGLLVAGENSRSLLESTIRKMNEDETLTRQSVKPLFASLTIGSGAAAVVMSRDDVSKNNHRLLGESSLSMSQYNHLCRGDGDAAGRDHGDTLMNTDAETLMRRGVETAAETWTLLKRQMDWTDDSIDNVCTHQVGASHKRLLMETLGIAPEKDYSTLEFLGNVGSVSCPVTMAMAVENDVVTSGSTVALLGIGSGINCTMLALEW